MTKRILLSLFIIALFASCSPSAKVTTDPDSRRLVFGHGGGFTGIYSTYEIEEDGNVFAILPDSTLQSVKKLRKKKVRELFTQADKLKISQTGFNHPGNMTWFVKYQADGIITEYKWGDSNASVPVEIQDLYNQLNTIVK